MSGSPTRCQCEFCRGGSTYYCTKLRSGLLDGHSNGAGLTTAEKFLVGLLPKAPPAATLSHLLEAEGRRAIEYAARVRGIRWLIDIAGMDERLEVTT